MTAPQVVKVPTDKTCKQMTDLIFGYLNDTLSRPIKRDFDTSASVPTVLTS